MKLAELIDKARRVVALSTNETTEYLFAVSILDLLAEAAPCGYAEPYATVDGLVVVPDEWGGTGDPERARHMARMLLRAADEAEAK